MKSVVRGFFSFLSLAVIFLAALGQAQELKPVRISTSLGAGQLGLWVTRDAGLFSKYGLNVEFIGIQSASRQVQLLFSGDTLLSSSSGTTPVRARIEGGDTIIIMGLLNSFTLSIMAVPEVKEPKDLKGRVIGVGSMGGSPTLLSQRVLKKWGLEQDVKFIPTGGYVEASPPWKTGASTPPCSIRLALILEGKNSASMSWPIWERNSNTPRPFWSRGKAWCARNVRH
jgi:ABC-type nitrate/sulfonate/bicarbonate transport system substrate-binding protein